MSSARLRPKAVEAFSKWIRVRVAANEPWDRFVREIVEATGSTFENENVPSAAVTVDTSGGSSVPLLLASR